MSLSIIKPTVGGSNGVWGTTLNTALDAIVAAINALSPTTGPQFRATTGAPVITGYGTAGGDQAGDFAMDADAGIIYGPLVITGSPSNGNSWNTGGTCSADINPLAPNAAQTSGFISGWKGEAFPRALALIDQITMVTGTAVAAWVYFPKGTVISNLSFALGGTGATTPTHSWLRLSDSSRVQLAVTADAGTTPITSTFSVITRAIATIAAGSASSFTTTYSGLHLIELIVVASGMPKLYGLPSNPPMNSAPGLGGTTDTGITAGPPSFPHTASALSFIGVPLPYLGAS